MMNHWNIRFQTEGYVYGREPNAFLEEFQKKIKISGEALTIAEGDEERRPPVAVA